MKPSFHEDYSRRHEVKSGTDRGFGLTVGAILLLISGLRAALHLADAQPLGWFAAILAAIGVVLLGCGWFAPRCLSGLHGAWIKLGLVLLKVVNPIVLGMIYFVTVVPTGLIMRALGHDPLHLKFDPAARSYWMECKPSGFAPETMTNQF